jgi:hypothetical protein
MVSPPADNVRVGAGQLPDQPQDLLVRRARARHLPHQQFEQKAPVSVRHTARRSSCYGGLGLLLAASGPHPNGAQLAAITQALIAAAGLVSVFIPEQ